MDTLWPFKAAVKEQWQHINLPLNFQPFFIGPHIRQSSI